MRATNQNQRKKNNINQNIYKKILENIRDAFLIAQDGKTKYANVKMLELLGYDSEEELVGKEFKNFIHPDDYPRVLSNHQRRLLGEQFDSVYEFNLLRKNGKFVPVEIRVALLEWEGRPATLNFLIDITERKQAEKMLRESEERFRILANATWEGIIIHKEGIILDVNASALKMCGYTAEEVIGKNVIDFLAPESTAPALQKLRESTTSDQLYIEVNILRKDKTILKAEALGRPIRYNKLDARVMAIRDVSERKRAEETKRESEERYRMLVENIPQKIFIKDRDSLYVSVNESYARDLGIRSAEVRGKSDYDFFPQKLADKYRLDDKRIMQTGCAEELEEEYIQDGYGVWVHTIKVPVKDERGKITGVFGIFMDITERKQAEKALRESEERFRQLADATFEGVLIHVGGVIQDINQSMIKMFGYEYDEILGKNIFALIGPESKETIMQQLKKPSDKPFEIIVNRKDGTTMITEAVERNLSWKGNKARVVALHDITERKTMVAQLESSYQQLRVLNQRWVEIEELERKRLSAELHDEIGQNLTALGINFGIVKMNLPPATDSLVYNRIDDSLSLLKRSSIQVKSIMSNLRPALLDDYGLVPALHWYTQDIAQRTGIEISCTAEKLHCRLPTETETALFRIAQEAINNSVKHAKAKHISLALSYAENRLYLVIGDDGVGFEIQVSPRQDSRGWGLMIIKERCVGIKGICQIESKPGRGTKISIEVPL